MCNFPALSRKIDFKYGNNSWRFFFKKKLSPSEDGQFRIVSWKNLVLYEVLSITIYQFNERMWLDVHSVPPNYLLREAGGSNLCHQAVRGSADKWGGDWQLMLRILRVSHNQSGVRELGLGCGRDHRVQRWGRVNLVGILGTGGNIVVVMGHGWW